MRNTFEYLSILTTAITDAKRSDGDVKSGARDAVVTWVTEAESAEQALVRIYSVASGDIFQYDDGETAYTLEDDWEAEGIEPEDARERFYDIDVRREGERLIFG